MRERGRKKHTAVDTILSIFYDFENIAVYNNLESTIALKQECRQFKVLYLDIRYYINLKSTIALAGMQAVQSADHGQRGESPRELGIKSHGGP